MLSRCLLTKFLRRSSVGKFIMSALSVGREMDPKMEASSHFPLFFFGNLIVPPVNLLFTLYYLLVFPPSSSLNLCCTSLKQDATTASIQKKSPPNPTVHDGPTNDAPLTSFRLSSDAEILLVCWLGFGAFMYMLLASYHELFLYYFFFTYMGKRRIHPSFHPSCQSFFFPLLRLAHQTVMLCVPTHKIFLLVGKESVVHPTGCFSQGGDSMQEKQKTHSLEHPAVLQPHNWKHWKP